jgi:uncharacterized protein
MNGAFESLGQILARRPTGHGYRERGGKYEANWASRRYSQAKARRNRPDTKLTIEIQLYIHISIHRGPHTREMKYDFMAPKARNTMAEDQANFEFLAPAGFEWDDAKSDANLIKHGISFDDASEVFYGPIVIRKSTRNDEERWLAIGISHDRLMSVIFTRRQNLIRVISARNPRPNEKRAYRDASMGRSAEGKD